MSLTFKGINLGGYGGYDLTDILLINLKWWIDWGLVHNGAYQPYLLSDDESVLKSVEDSDRRYSDGQVWEGVGREWVWESGIQVPSGAIQPFRVSGVYINSAFYPIDTIGTYAHHIDYQNGRVIFEQPQSDTTEVKVEYTTRSVFVDEADKPAFSRLMLGASEDFLEETEPSSTPAREFQVWLPSIFIQVDRGQQQGLQLGGGQIKRRIINFYIFTEYPSDRNMLMDWLDFQSRTAFMLADLNEITFPFDQYGGLVSGATNWVDMANTYPYKKLRVMDSVLTRLDSLNSNLFRARVQYEVEIDFGGI